MKAVVITWVAHLRESYWFVPSLMAIGAVILSFITTYLDAYIGASWLEEISWFYANKPAGARAVLSTVAGSMITVAGVTFSMTILSISYTTSQVGARLLNNFMRDTANQVTLGVFISTFLYCLMVLRTVRNGADVGSDSSMTAFVPHIAVSVGLLLAIASVGVLIYFIHHIPESIHISNIVAGVGRDLNQQIDKQFPSRVGQPHPESTARQSEADLPQSFYRSARAVTSVSTGYVKFVDTDGLMRIATEHDLVVRMRFRAGDFITPGNLLMSVSPDSTVDEALAKQLRATLITGSQRTPRQNLRFVFNQLTEVAIRALSPGVNDPFTATNCLDWLQSALENLSQRQMPDAYRYDDAQHLRIVAEPESFANFADLVLHQLRPYVSADQNASVHMMETLAKVTASASCSAHRRLLLRHACLLRRDCRMSLPNRQWMRMLDERFRSIVLLIKDDAYRQQVVQTGHWTCDRSQQHLGRTPD